MKGKALPRPKVAPKINSFQATEIIRNLLFPSIQSYPECAYYTCTFIVELCEREGLCLNCKVRGTGPSVAP